MIPSIIVFRPILIENETLKTPIVIIKKRINLYKIRLVMMNVLCVNHPINLCSNLSDMLLLNLCVYYFKN